MPYGGNPVNDPSDAVRVMVGDINPATPRLDDQTYLMIIGQESSLFARAALAASLLAGKYANQYTRRIGDLWVEAKVQYQHYEALAKWFRLESSRRGRPIVFGGGIDVSDVANRKADDSIVQPYFTTGMMDSIEVSPLPAGC